MGKYLFKNGRYLAYDNQRLSVKRGDILVEDTLITKIAESIEDAQAEVIDASAGFVMPGLINTHTHAAMTLLRSYADDMELKTWLEEKIWPAEANLEAEHVYWASMLAFAEMIRSGTTTYADMYFYMDQVAEATLEIGMRAVLARGLIEFTDPDKKNIQETIDLIKKYHNTGDGTITCLFGPHAAYTCTPDYIQAVIEAADQQGVGIHIHIAETAQEIQDIQKMYGKTPVEHLEATGLFNRHVVAAHCVHVSETDIDILKKYNVGVCHNPTSNLKLASGIAPVPQMLAAGLHVGIGTDGASSNNNLNMFEEMHLTSLIHKGHTLDPMVTSAEEVLKMATIEGAKVLGIADKVGSVEVGKKADLIMIDLQKTHLAPEADLMANMVYSAQGSDVQHVMINGKMVLQDYRLLTANESVIIDKAAEMKAQMLKT